MLRKRLVQQAIEVCSVWFDQNLVFLQNFAVLWLDIECLFLLVIYALLLNLLNAWKFFDLASLQRQGGKLSREKSEQRLVFILIKHLRKYFILLGIRCSSISHIYILWPLLYVWLCIWLLALTENRLYDLDYTPESFGIWVFSGSFHHLFEDCALCSALLLLGLNTLWLLLMLSLGFVKVFFLGFRLHFFGFNS